MVGVRSGVEVHVARSKSFKDVDCCSKPSRYSSAELWMVRFCGHVSLCNSCVQFCTSQCAPVRISTETPRLPSTAASRLFLDLLINSLQSSSNRQSRLPQVADTYRCSVKTGHVSKVRGLPLLYTPDVFSLNIKFVHPSSPARLSYSSHSDMARHGS